MTALEALKIARETGKRITPMTYERGHFVLSYDKEGRLYQCRDRAGAYIWAWTLDITQLINSDGSPVEWEVITEEEL